MVRTRGQGAPPEGFTEYMAPKRTRNPRSSSIVSLPRNHQNHLRRQVRQFSTRPLPPTSPDLPQTPSHYLDKALFLKYQHAATQTDPMLTGLPEPINGKRRRDSQEPESSSKRPRNALTPQPEKRQPTAFFSTQRKKSYLLQKPTVRESPLYAKAFESRFIDVNARKKEKYPAQPPPPVPTPPSSPPPTSQDADRGSPPQTPEKSTEPGLFGSVKKFFGGFIGGSASKTQVEKSPSSPKTTPASEERTRPLPAPEDKGTAAQTQAHTDDLPPSPLQNKRPQPALWEQSFKRRRYANSLPSASSIQANAGPTEEVEDAEFVRKEAGSNKRVLAAVDGKIPGPSTGGFGIDDNYLDVENEIDGIDTGDAGPSTPTKSVIVPSTPLRSALRQMGTLGRSAKSVRINPNTSIKHVYGQYGPAGQYHGSTFSDGTPLSITDSSLSSIPKHDVTSILSPTTIENTRNNFTPKFRLDSNVFDPNDSSWRPSLANPSPGRFRVPDADEFDDFDEDELSELEKEPQNQGQGREHVPSQPPSTPRMSHAELPPQPASPSTTVSAFTNNDDGNIFNDSQETRLNKARLDAQKYKPVRSSRLSHGEPARSRSSSPPLSEGDFTQSNLEIGTPGDFRPAYRDADTSEMIVTPRKPAGREDLDDTTVGEDGKTDYGREHEFDEWAINLFEPVRPQTYEEAGTTDGYIGGLIQKHWTQRDTDEAIAFWRREFDEGIKAANEASAHGKQLRWITDPTEIAEHMAAAY